MINRRLFLAGMLTSGAVAPAVVSAKSIMPVVVPRVWVPEPWVLLPDFDYSAYELRVASFLSSDDKVARVRSLLEPSLTSCTNRHNRLSSALALVAFQNRGLQFPLLVKGVSRETNSQGL